jgi:hypothetical protein
MSGWRAVLAAVSLAVSGEHEQGRRELMSCWRRTSATDHAQRCVIAHYLADLHSELHEKVTWDERALSAYAQMGESELAVIGIASVREFAPSLHLNLGDGYLRLGRISDAAAQLHAGLDAQDALPQTGYGELVSRGLAGLAKRVEAATSATRE